LIHRVTKDIGIEIEELTSSKRGKKISYARALISYLAAMELRYSGVEIARALRLSGKSVSRCIERGKFLVDNHQRIYQYLQ